LVLLDARLGAFASFSTFQQADRSVMPYQPNASSSSIMLLGIRCIFAHCRGLCNSVERAMNNKTRHPFHRQI
ncbi:hypothetical protein PQR34_48150, partial [Paraburkholderia sediminicola]|uniref:hypothetical protein n=1 Tax=Paraburkholderia sediminicola TaxID=458836 RepID=UPI0038BB3DBC